MNEWDTFTKTGKVEDYLRYVEAKQRKKEKVKQTDGDKNGRIGYP